jgi:hypothetical protein
MFARIVKCIPKLEKEEGFLKAWRPATRTQQVAASNGVDPRPGNAGMGTRTGAYLISRVDRARGFDCW